MIMNKKYKQAVGLSDYFFCKLFRANAIKLFKIIEKGNARVKTTF